MKNKLIRSMLLVALVSILLALGFVVPRLYWAIEQDTFIEMRDISTAVEKAMELAEDKAGFLREIRRDMPEVRFSWISAMGEVLFDSEVAQVSGMENHASREEITEAVESGEGSASRRSASIGESTHYFARRLSDNSILRVARTERIVVAELIGLIPSFALIALLVITVSFVLSELFTKRLIKPINQLDLERPEENEVDAELAPLLNRLMQQNRRIQEQLQTNRENARKTAAITENMAEGLIMLSTEGHIVSINGSAAAMLGGTTERFYGLHYMAACRNLDFHRHIKRAFTGERSESRLTLSGRTIHVLADPVFDGDALNGAILLLLDITEHERAEAIRREFSANVSHELKTPLTTIAGYAEMMQAGLSDARDNAALAGKILMEARRLLALIEDIIKLSRLDESMSLAESEPVDLFETAQAVVERLTAFASERDVSISVSGGEAHYVTGSPVLLDEMLQNVVDNAIRYNHAGGKVGIALSAEDADVILRVTDTGVGIAQEHHARIFERFYRVDKSHSRSTGGTGLGLSIVKHCVQLHRGRLSLESRPEKGTEIVIALPKGTPDTRGKGGRPN